MRLYGSADQHGRLILGVARAKRLVPDGGGGCSGGAVKIDRGILTDATKRSCMLSLVDGTFGSSPQSDAILSDSLSAFRYRLQYQGNRFRWKMKHEDYLLGTKRVKTVT